MRFSLLAALAAATALIPVAATAQNHQDRGGWHGGGHDNDGNRNNGSRADRGDGRRDARPAARPATARPSFNRPATTRPQAQRPDRADNPARFDRGNRPASAANGNWRTQAGGSQAGNRPDHNDWNRGQNNRGGQWNHGRDDRGGQYNRGRDDRGGQYNHGRDDRGGQWNRGQGNRGSYNRDWRRDNRYDWRGYRNHNRGAYHLPRYYAPHNWGYGYRRFGIGFRLSSVLFGSNYWISDPYAYRLPPAYGPYRWVRYYNDALLVDVRTGNVVDTVYDIFW